MSNTQYDLFTESIASRDLPPPSSPHTHTSSEICGGRVEVRLWYACVHMCPLSVSDRIALRFGVWLETH